MRPDGARKIIRGGVMAGILARAVQGGFVCSEGVLLRLEWARCLGFVSEEECDRWIGFVAWADAGSGSAGVAGLGSVGADAECVEAAMRAKLRRFRWERSVGCGLSRRAGRKKRRLRELNSRVVGVGDAVVSGILGEGRVLLSICDGGMGSSWGSLNHDECSDVFRFLVASEYAGREEQLLVRVSCQLHHNMRGVLRELFEFDSRLFDDAVWMAMYEYVWAFGGDGAHSYVTLPGGRAYGFNDMVRDVYGPFFDMPPYEVLEGPTEAEVHVAFVPEWWWEEELGVPPLVMVADLKRALMRIHHEAAAMWRWQSEAVAARRTMRYGGVCVAWAAVFRRADAPSCGGSLEVVKPDVGSFVFGWTLECEAAVASLELLFPATSAVWFPALVMEAVPDPVMVYIGDNAMATYAMVDGELVCVPDGDGDVVEPELEVALGLDFRGGPTGPW